MNLSICFLHVQTNSLGLRQPRFGFPRLIFRSFGCCLCGKCGWCISRYGLFVQCVQFQAVPVLGYQNHRKEGFHDRSWIKKGIRQRVENSDLRWTKKKKDRLEIGTFRETNGAPQHIIVCTNLSSHSNSPKANLMVSNSSCRRPFVERLTSCRHHFDCESWRTPWWIQFQMNED